jgi:hypothetical protein
MDEAVVAASALPQAWPAVLAEVENAVREAEAAAADREKALDGEPAPGPDAGLTAWDACRQRLQDCLDGLETCAARAAENASEAEAAIAAVEQEAERWQAAFRALGQRLAADGASELK